MAASARIDELRSKFEENPRRYFAPLANEYRKAGDLGTAIALLRTQLRLFPQHMSGHVVLGQALFEAGELQEARQVFERAVELDAENLIALRHLGDISRELGDTERARSWYRRVLDVDPYNEQIASLLDQLAAPTTHAEPANREDMAGLTEVTAWPPPIELSPEPPHEPERAPHAEAEAQDTPQAEPGGAPSAESPEFIDLAEDDFLAWAPPAASESVSTHDVEPTPAPDVATAEPEPPAPRLDSVDAATFDPVVGLDLVPVHDEALEQLDQAAALAPPEQEPPPPVARTPEAHTPEEPAPEEPAPEEPTPVAQAPELESADAEAPAAWIPEEGAPLELVTSDAFATETMAELCLEQGHEEEALAIYERLVAQRPDDAALAERSRALRERLHPSAAPSPEPVGADSHGRVDERDAWAADAWAGALRVDAPAPEPLFPAETVEDISFDRFFADADYLDEPVAAAPAAPVPTSPVSTSPAPAAADRDAVEPPSPAHAPPAASEPSAAPAPEEEDLAEFNAWLKGLRDS